MPTTTYTFSTPSNYVYDPSEIDVIAGVAQLALQTAAMLFNEGFDDDTGFTYDNVRAEFVSNQLQQRDVTPASSIFGVSYDVNANPITNEADLNWHKSGGSVTAVLNGSPVIVGNRLVCVGSQGAYYQRNSTIIETHKFRYTPNYNTSPPSNVNIFSCDNNVNNNDRFLLTHSPSGDTLRLTLNDIAGVSIIPVATSLVTWQPVAGQEYEFEIVIDSITDAVRVFIDGILVGSNSPGAWVRGTTSLRYYLGATPNIYNVAAGDFNDYITFNDAQHSADYAPGYAVDLTLYQISVVDLPLFSHGGLGFIIALLAMTTLEGGSPRYTLSVDGGNQQYWNGTAWANSNGMYAQSNDIVTFNANISTLPNVGMTTTLGVRVHFTSDNIQSSVDQLTINHIGNTAYLVTNPEIIPTAVFHQDLITQFIPSTTEVGLDAVQYTLSVETVEYWFNGVAWAVSNATYAESNDAATIQANIATFTIKGATVPVSYLHSDNGLTSPSVDSLTIGYNFFAGATTPENVCLVWGYLYDELDTPLASRTVVVTPTVYGAINDKLITRDPRQVVTDVNGYWSISLVETESTNNSWAYKFDFPGFSTIRVVPNLVSAQFNQLGELAT